MPAWSQPLDFAGATAAFDGAWSAPLDFAGTTGTDAIWSDPLDFQGQTALGFGIVSAGAYAPGQDCVLTVAGVDAAYTLTAAGQAVDTTDDLDVNGDGTITFVAPRVTAYGGDLELVLSMGGFNAATNVTQIPEPGLAAFAIGVVMPKWASGLSVSAGDQIWNRAAGVRGRLYQATTTGITGGNAPVHTSGIAFDGGVSWSHVGDYLRLESDAEFEPGDQIAVNNVVGGVVGGITVDQAAVFQAAEAIYKFDFGVWDGTEWGSFATQVITPYLSAMLTVWDGAAWQRAPLKRQDGGWQSHQLKRWNGTNWIED